MKSLNSIIKSYSFITEEGAEKYQFLFIYKLSDIDFKVNQKIITLRELRGFKDNEKKYEAKTVSRFLTVIVKEI